MRVVLAALLCCFATAAEAAPAAQIAFVERRGLLEADVQCRLFTPEVHAALQAGAGQARGALLRAGWTRAQMEELEQAAIGAARQRACDDARTLQSAASVRSGFSAWVRLTATTFPGWERFWTARRFADINGWRLSQDIAPGIQFGVRDRDGGQVLSLLLPQGGAQGAPATVQLVMRDPARASAALLDLHGRLASGLEAGAPAPRSAQHFLASARRVEPADRFHAQRVVFEFPEAAFQAMLRLDPREAVEVQMERNGQTQRLLIEVGDIAPARVFLTARAS